MFTNLKQIQKNLKKTLNVISKTQTEALEEIGLRGVGILDRNTIVISGRLRASMSYTINDKVIAPLGPKRPNDKLRRSKDKKIVIIGTNVIYGPRVEYLSQTGSAGYMLRSYKQLKPIAKKIMKTVFNRKGF